MKALLGTVLLTLSGIALAGLGPADQAGTIPEPGVLGLIAIAAVAGIVVSRSRKK